MASPKVSIGQDVTDLMNGPKVGDDVSHLMGGEEPVKKEEKEKPGFLSRAKEFGEGMLNMVKHPLDTASSLNDSANRLFGGYYDKDINPNPQLHPEELATLAGLNPANIKNDYQEGNWGALAGDIGPQIALAGLGKIGGKIFSKAEIAPKVDVLPAETSKAPLMLNAPSSIPEGANIPFQTNESTLANLNKRPIALGPSGGYPEAPKGYVPPVDLGQIAEQKRLEGLTYSQDPNALRLPDKKIPNLPAVSGDTSTGFNPQSQADLPYPLNIAPDVVRPRSAQTTLEALGAPRSIPKSNPLDPISFEDQIPAKPEEPLPLSDISPSAAIKPGRTLPTIKERNTPQVLGAELDKHPDIKNGDMPKPPIDELNSLPDKPKVPTDNVLPKPGSARASKDINTGRAWLGSVDQTLMSRPESAPIAATITSANDAKLGWIASTERELAQTTKGLGKADRVILGQILDGHDVPNASPDVIQRAEQARKILDSVHEEATGAVPEAKVGYIESYLTHIDKQDVDMKSAISSILDYHLGKNHPLVKWATEEPLSTRSGSGVGDMYDKAMGDPSSPFIKERSDALRNLQYDVNKVFPAYIESMAKVIHDKPAVDQAKVLIGKLPDGSKLKELATWYVKNYTKYDSMPGLDEAWNNWSNQIARTTSRSMLGLNTGLQTLHAARLVGNLWPELGTKYTAKGLAKVALSPINSWHEASKLGLLSNEIRPLNFRTNMEKLDSIMNLFSTVDAVDKAVGYHGFKQKFMDQGMSPETAQMEALNATKKTSLTTDMARPIRAFTNEGGLKEGAMKLTTQYKQVPMKIVEQWMQVAAKAKQDRKAAMRMVTGVGAVLAAYEAGLHTFHVSPTNMIDLQMWGPSKQILTGITTDLAKGDVVSAVGKLALWLTPGGMSIKKQIEQGPSALEQGPKQIKYVQ